MFKLHDEVEVTNFNLVSVGLTGFVVRVDESWSDPGTTVYKVVNPDSGYIGRFTAPSLKRVNAPKEPGGVVKSSSSKDDSIRVFNFFLTDDNDPVKSVEDLFNLSNVDVEEPFFTTVCSPSELRVALLNYEEMHEVMEWEHCYATSGTEVYELEMSFASSKIV